MEKLSIIIQAILEQQGITKSLQDIQKLVKNNPVEISAKLESASLRNNIRSISREIANSLNNIPDLDIKISANDVSKVLISLQNESNKLTNDLSKAVERINQLKNTKSLDLKFSNIEKEYSRLQALDLVTKELETDFERLKAIKNSFESSNSDQELVANYTELNAQMERVINSQKIIKNSENSQLASSKQAVIFESKREKIIQEISTYLKKNSKLTSENSQEAKTLYNEFLRIQTAIKNLNINDPKYSSQFTILSNELQTAKKRMKELGLEGRSSMEDLKNTFNKLKNLFGISQLTMIATDQFRNSINEIKELDTTLTEISKTSDLTTAQLKELGDTSFDTASKYGRSANDYLNGVLEMSRSGFYGDKGTAMAVQSVLAQAAGDMTEEVANQYILATNAAYKYNGEAEKINAVLDGQNSITNRNSVAMTDMATAMSEAGTVASSYRVSIEDLSAMIGTIESVTKLGGSEVGNGIKSILINLQNVSSSKIVDTLASAKASMTEMVNGTEQLRDPISILRDLAKTFNSLDEADPLKAEILTNIGGKYQATKLSALLQNMDMFDKMLVDYSEGSGSAMQEAEKSANNLDGSLNRLSNTWTKTVNNIADSTLLINSVNVLNTLLSGVESLTDKLGLLKTIGTIGLTYLNQKNSGGLIRLISLINNSPFLATVKYNSDVYEFCVS